MFQVVATPWRHLVLGFVLEMTRPEAYLFAYFCITWSTLRVSMGDYGGSIQYTRRRFIVVDESTRDTFFEEEVSNTVNN